jgi:hypothetical protein
MRIARISAVAVAAVCLASAPAFAGGQKGKSGHAPTPQGANAHAQAPKTAGTHGNPHTTTSGTTTPTTSSHGSSHAAKETTTTKAHGNPHATTPTGENGATTPTMPVTASTTTLNPIAQKLQSKPLGARIEKMLPVGMTLDTASDGFRNQGQFIAAVHVSQNLGIPFADLKAAMLGTPLPGSTTALTSPMSLGQAIQQLKPFANSTAAVSRAEVEADHDLGTIGATSTTASRTITSAKPKKRGK